MGVPFFCPLDIINPVKNNTEKKGRRPMDDEFIFVYGTLRTETATVMSHLLVRHSEYLSNGVMQGRLYELDGYPGAVESREPDDKVLGALYRIVDRDMLLPELDLYEECTDNFPEPHEYVRKKVLISRDNGDSLIAWAYLFNRETSNLLQIKSGDYLNFTKEVER